MTLATLAQPTRAGAARTSTLERAPRASVIVVNYNAGRQLTQCLRALQKGCRQDDEIILVDNASTDSSAAEVTHAFPGVQVVRSEANLGFGCGNNLGARQARGRYLAFLNPDTVVEPGWLEALINALEADPQAGLATSRILLLNDPGRINTCGNECHYTGLALCRGMGMDRGAFDQLEAVSAVSGAAFAMRRALFQSLGGFDETFFMYVEDTDLSWRARLAGYRCLYVPASIVYHDYTLRFGPRKTFYQERNRYMMLLKALRWPTLLVLLPALLLAELVTWSFVLLRDRNRLRNKLQAYIWIVRHWDRVMESRRQAQAQRRDPDRDLIASCSHRLAFEQTGAGLPVRLAHRVCDPLFYMYQRLALAVIWW
jgi:GT2 family glycosyltransferase